METIAGKQRANQIAAILTNFDTVEKSLDTMTKSAGTAKAELDKINDSLEGRISILSNSFEKLSTSFISSSTAKGAVSFLTSILDLLDSITSKVGGLGAVVEGVMMFQAFRGNGALNFATDPLTKSGKGLNFFGNASATGMLNNFRDANGGFGSKLQAAFQAPISKQDINVLRKYNETVKAGTSQQIAYARAQQQLSRNGKALLNTTIRQTEATNEATGATQAAVVADETLEAAENTMSVAQKFKAKAAELLTKGLSTLFSVASTALLMFTINKVVELMQAKAKAMEQAKEQAEQMGKERKELASLKEQYKEICTSVASEAEKTKKLDEWKKTLIDTYGMEEEALKNVNGTRKDGIDLIEKESIARQRKYLRENKTAINEARSYIQSNPMDKLKTTNVFRGLFPTTEYKEYTKELQKIAEQTDNVIEFTKKLESMRDDLTTKSVTNQMTDKDTSFLNYLNVDVESFNKKLIDKGYEEVYNESMPSQMNIIAYTVANNKKYLEIYKDTYDEMDEITRNLYEGQMGNMTRVAEIAAQYGLSLEELKSAYSMFGDFYGLDKAEIEEFSNALKDFDNTIDLLPDSITKTLGELRDLYETIDGLKTQFTSLNSLVDTSKEAINNIDAILEKQKDPIAVYNSDEMSDILAKYPELTHKIQECSKGYRVQAEALDDLKAKRLQVEKENLQSTLDDQVAVRQGVINKLKSYQEELGGIKDIATAKLELAKLDSQLSGAKNDVFNSWTVNKASSQAAYNNKKEIEDKKTALQQYIEIEESINTSKEAAEAIQLRIDMLGKSFEDVDSETKKIEENLKKAKDNISKSSDDLKKAKEKIESLLKLTIEMIKKQKELEKQTLQDQLDAFKKVIDLKKQQLKIEEDIHKYTKEKTEKEKDVSDIQKDIDLLSLDDSLEGKKKRLELEQQLADKQVELDEFVYDHNNDTREQELDDIEKTAEEETNVKIKALEDYLSKEGIIRQDAMNLINGKTEEFYNDLRDYTTTYSEYSLQEFEKLWTEAYQYLYKYGNGQLDICDTLFYISGQIEYLEQNLKDLEDQANSATEALKGMSSVLGDLKDVEVALHGINEEANGINLNQPLHWRKTSEATWSGVSGAAVGHKDWSVPNLPKYHTGGVVKEGVEVAPHSSEVLAKLLKGELVLTDLMQSNLIKTVLPDAMNTGAKMAQNHTNISLTVNTPEIKIQGNADLNTVNQLKDIQKQTQNNIFSQITASFRHMGVGSNTANN